MVPITTILTNRGTRVDKRGGEQHAVLGVHRAVDEAVQADPGLTGAAASVLSAYAVGAAGWSDRFARMLIDHTSVEEVQEVFPPLEDALVQLAEEGPEHAWQGVRRLQVLVALTRVSLDHAPGGAAAELVQRALRPLVPEDTDASELHALLLHHANLNASAWEGHVEHLVNGGWLDPTYQARSAAPCCGEIIGVEIEGDVEPVTVLTTHSCAPDLTVAQLETLLDPAHWPDCPGFWCAMDELPPPVGYEAWRHFLEVVASDCAGNAKISTRLLFFRRSFVDGSASLEYRLSPDQSSPADGLVVVDEGSILVEPADPGPGVCVTSTKRIRFIEPMDGAHLAMTACALGWEGAGEQFMFGCPSDEPQPPTPADELTA